MRTSTPPAGDPVGGDAKFIGGRFVAPSSFLHQILIQTYSIAAQQAPPSRNQKRAQECLYEELLSASWVSNGGIGEGERSLYVGLGIF